MSRASWKVTVVNKRSTTINPALLNKTINVHNGKVFVPINITTSRLGHKLGEFCLTKKSAVYSK